MKFDYDYLLASETLAKINRPYSLSVGNWKFSNKAFFIKKEWSLKSSTNCAKFSSYVFRHFKEQICS